MEPRPVKRKMTISLDVPVILRPWRDSGIWAAVDLNGSKRISGYGNTEQEALDEVQHELRQWLKGRFN